MTLELYDGARVLLRNGETRVIRRDPKNNNYPWKADGSTPAACWTAEGRYTIAPGDHVLDIVGIHKTDAAKPDSNLFDIIPYSGDYQPRGDEKYGLRNGREINGLMFLGDEIHTSQRDMVWTRIDGRCRVPSRHDLAAARDISEAGISRLLSQHDIVEILIPKAPAALANDQSKDYPYTAPRTVMMDESGHVYDDMEVPADRPKLAPIEDRREAAIQRMTGVGGDWRETQVPRKRLYKTMESIAEGLGGEIGEWEWGADPSTIRFSVLFDNPMRNGVHVGYEKWLTLSVTDDEHNAMLPMTARK